MNKEFKIIEFRHLFAVIVLGLISFSLQAKVVVTDAATGNPLPKASIFDNQGIFIAVADDDGVVPESINPASYPLHIRYLGYMPVEIENPMVGTVGMVESSYTLPEVTVDDVSRNLLYIQAYIREYTTLLDPNDTIGHYKEQIVDYVIPVAKKTKFKGWKKPRMLAQRNYKQVKTVRKKSSIDTLKYSENIDKHGMSFPVDNKFKVPQPILDGQVKEYVIEGKYSPEEVWKVSDNYYVVTIDELANDKNHTFAPGFLKLFGASAALTANEETFMFEKTDKGPSVENLVEATSLWNLILKGKLFKKATEQKEDSDLSSFSEMFVINRAYLTAEEAKDLKENAPVFEAGFQIPDGIPAPPAEVLKFKEMVIESTPEAK